MLFSRKRSAAPADVIGDWLHLAERSIAGCKDAIPGNYAQKDFEYVAWNSHTGLGLHLERLALLHRAKQDKAGAKQELPRATVFLDYIEDAVAKCNASGFTERNFVNVGNFTNAFLVCFLANDWQRAHRLATAARLPVVQEEGLEGESGGIHDEIAKMLIAVALDDAAALDHHRTRFQKDRKGDRFWETYFGYDVLMDFIVKRDGRAFDGALIEQEASFKARATDRKAGRTGVLEACLENNALVFDVWAVALGNLARDRGLDVTYSSELIPMSDFSPA